MISYSDFQQLDLRVAEIVEAKEHPNADKLCLLKVKIADEERQIIAGIRPKYAMDILPGKKVVLICNLEPATIRGEMSEGMLLAASDDSGPVLISPEEDVPSGVQVR